MFAVRLARTNRAMVRAYVRTVSAYAERIIPIRAIPDCTLIRCHYLGVSPEQETSTMTRYMMLVCVAMAGCEQKTVVIANERVAEAGAPVATLSPNEQCANSDECDSGECVPIYGNALPDGGSCWSDSFVGCERVNFEDWVIAAFCDWHQPQKQKRYAKSRTGHWIHGSRTLSVAIRQSFDYAPAPPITP